MFLKPLFTKGLFFLSLAKTIIMKYMRKRTLQTALLLFLSFIFLSAGCKKEIKNSDDSGKPYVVMLSLDGFRWDYTEHAHTPVLDSLKEAGVFAEMIPSFPTKTFPNHYSIATGLYPDHHGIVLNSFYATDLGKEYSISDRKSVGNGIFYGGEPIWVTAQKQGMRAATLYWVGSEAAPLKVSVLTFGIVTAKPCPLPPELTAWFAGCPFRIPFVRILSFGIIPNPMAPDTVMALQEKKPSPWWSNWISGWESSLLPCESSLFTTG